METTPQIIKDISAQAAQRNLSVLIRLRWLAITGQIVAILVTHYGMGVALPLGQMAAVIGLLGLLNLISLWQLRAGRTISDLVVSLELLLDVGALTLLLYFSGGASNPFVNLFILQVILGIVLLPGRRALGIVAATIVAYYWLLRHGIAMEFPPMEPNGHTPMPGFFSLHRDGMFWSFVLAACLLSWFVLRISINLRERDTQIAELRRQMLEEDHLVRLGLLSSGAAHELSTPLTTLAVTLDDWREYGVPEADKRDHTLGRMLDELTRCRRIVSDMLLTSGQERLEDVHPERAGRFIARLVQDWQTEGGALAVHIDDQSGPAETMADPTLSQALRQLLDNAHEAGATTMSMTLRTAPPDRLMIVLVDNGPGFPPDALAARERGDMIVPSNPGRGLGLLLVLTAMRRLSGTLTITNVEGGGASVTLDLPIVKAS